MQFNCVALHNATRYDTQKQHKGTRFAHFSDERVPGVTRWNSVVRLESPRDSAGWRPRLRDRHTQRSAQGGGENSKSQNRILLLLQLEIILFKAVNMMMMMGGVVEMVVVLVEVVLLVVVLVVLVMVELEVVVLMVELWWWVCKWKEFKRFRDITGQ